MQNTCVVTESATQWPSLVLRSVSTALLLETEINEEETADCSFFIDRLRIIYLKHIECDDALSAKIQEIAEEFILADHSEINNLNACINLAHACKEQFSRILRNDFDLAPLEDPVLIRDWKFEKWQLIDFIQLDTFFGRREEAISPFDQQPLPSEFETHPFVLDIINLLKTIPSFLQVVNTNTSSSSQSNPQAMPNHLSLLPAPDSNQVCNSATSLMARNDAVITPQVNMFLAFMRYNNYLSLANATLAEKKCAQLIKKLEIDSAARKLQNETLLQEIINREAQRLFAYFEERQQAVDAELEEAAQVRAEVASLKTQLEKATHNLKELQEKYKTQAQHACELQSQIHVERQKYVLLAQQIHSLQKKCKKKKWWKFW